MTCKVTYIGRQLLNPQVEGHYVASCRIISASSCSKIDPYVITLEQKGTALKKSTGRYAVINPVLKTPIRSGILPAVFLALNDLVVSAKVSSHIKTSDCDLIHVLNINKEAYLLAHILSNIKKPLLLHMLHSQYVLNDDVFRLRKIMFKLGIYSGLIPNHTITINASMRDFLITKLGLDGNKVHYVPLPVDSQKFKPMNRNELRMKYGLPLDQPIVAYAGSLNPSRGLFDLLESFSHVSSSFPDSLLFISYLKRKGEEVYEETLHRLARNSKLKKHVILRGASPHVEEIYNLADVVALPFARPYWIDPPLVLLEAMSSGSTIVSTTAGAISEIINNHYNGLLVPPKDPILLGNAISDLLSNPKESRRMARNARETIVKGYSYEEVGNKLLNVYREIQKI